MNFRKRNFAKQGESEHDDWPDVECHRSLAKNVNSPKLSHGPPRASKPCSQNIYFWLIRSHVSQSSEVTSLHIILSLSVESLGDVQDVFILLWLFCSVLGSYPSEKVRENYTVVSELFSCCCNNLAQLLCALERFWVFYFILNWTNGYPFLQEWYTSVITKICDWLSDRMSMALHQYQVQTLLALAAVSVSRNEYA